MEHLNICYPLLILFLLTSCEPSARHQEHDGGIRRYSALLQANYIIFWADNSIARLSMTPCQEKSL